MNPTLRTRGIDYGPNADIQPGHVQLVPALHSPGQPRHRRPGRLHSGEFVAVHKRATGVVRVGAVLARVHACAELERKELLDRQVG